MLTHPQFDPVAIAIGPVAVRWYGLMYLLAFTLFILLGRRRISQGLAQGWSREQLDDLLFFGVLGVVIGGRLGEAMRERDETAAQITASGATPAPAEPNYTLPGDATDPAQRAQVWAGLELAVLAGWTRLAAADPADRETAASRALSQAARVRSLGKPLPYWPGWV